MKDSCIFCKIIAGELPSNKVYEDKAILAFLDANPASEGHTLIIPKEHCENIYDIEEETLSKIAVLSKQLANIYKERLNIDNINILNSNGKYAQQDVPHYHMHLIPRKKDDKKLFKWGKQEVNHKKLLEKIGDIEI